MHSATFGSAWDAQETPTCTAGEVGGIDPVQRPPSDLGRPRHPGGPPCFARYWRIWSRLYVRRLAGAFLPGEDAHGRDAVEPHLGQRGEEDVPVHLPLPDVEMLVDARGRAGRVHDVAQAGRGAVVERVSDVHVGQQRPGVLHDPFDVAALMEGVRRAVQERHEVPVDPADQVDARPAVLHEVVRVRFEHQPDAFALEHRQQLLHRAPELRLAGRRRLRPPVELGVHHLHPEVHGYLDRPLPVAHRGLALVLVRARPPVQRQHRADLHAGRGQRLPEPGDLRLVRPRVQEERQEILPRRQLDAGVAEVRDDAGQLGQRHAAEHVGVERDLHGRDLTGLTAPSRRSRGARAGTPPCGCRSAAPPGSSPPRPWPRSRPRSWARSRTRRPPPSASPAAPRRRPG